MAQSREAMRHVQPIESLDYATGHATDHATNCAQAPSQGVQTFTALTLGSGTASPRISSRPGVRVTEKNRRP